MSKELVEAITKALYSKAHPDALNCSPYRENHYTELASAALAAIEREGFKVVPVEELNRLKAAASESSGHSYGNYRDGFGGSKWD